MDSSECWISTDSTSSFGGTRPFGVEPRKTDSGAYHQSSHHNFFLSHTKTKALNLDTDNLMHFSCGFISRNKIEYYLIEGSWSIVNQSWKSQ